LPLRDLPTSAASRQSGALAAAGCQRVAIHARPGRAPRAASHLLDVANLQPQCPPCAYSWPLRRSAGPGPRCWCHRQPRLWRQGDRCKGWTTRQGDRCKTTMPLRSFVWPTLAAPPVASPTASSTSWT
jgi:hypothetical protein